MKRERAVCDMKTSAYLPNYDHKQRTLKHVTHKTTLLAETFPLCFSALYCHSLRGLVARVLFWLFLCRGKDLCRQPLAIPVEHARDENAVTMDFLSRVGNMMPPPEFAHVFMSQTSHGNDSHSPC